jgi:hypothetical protein
MSARNTGGISGSGSKNISQIYKEIGGEIPTLKEFTEKIRSKKMSENKKYETTPKGVKAKVDNMGTKVLKSFGMN